MTKVAIIGDAHLNSTTPASRVDDYPRTTIRKLADIRRICIERGVHYAIFLGDVFHKNSQSQQYLNDVARELAKWQPSITPYTIRGNHDLAFEKIESKDRSPLELLLITGVMKHLDVLDLGDVVFKGFDYPEKLVPLETPKMSVCVAHRFYNYNLSDLSLHDKNLKFLGYDVYILGHDHMQYAPLQLDDMIVQRPGSLMRGTSHSYNLTREPSFDINTFDTVEGRVKMTIETVVLPHQPASEVFTTQALNKTKEDKIDPLLLSSQIDELVEKLNHHATNESLYSIVDSLDMEPATRVLIERYLKDNGLYREQVKEISENA